MDTGMYNSFDAYQYRVCLESVEVNSEGSDRHTRQRGRQLFLRLCFLVLVLGGAILAGPAAADTLGDIKTRGVLRCGVDTSLKGFSAQDVTGNWTGLNVDYCRALAATIFDDVTKVHFVPLSAGKMIHALVDGQVDVLASTSVWSFRNGTGPGIKFVGVIFYDGQGFLVRRDGGIGVPTQLTGHPVCVVANSPAEQNVSEYFNAHNMDYKPVRANSQAEAIADYAANRCDIFTADRSIIAAARAGLTDPKDHIILPDIISKTPFGPAVRQGDITWFNVARWTLFALIDAEELGVTRVNIDEMLGSDNPAVKRFLGVEEDLGTSLGLTKDWAYRIIKLVGNYGELYDRDIGPKTIVGLNRGLNNLSTQGGIQYAPPVR